MEKKKLKTKEEDALCILPENGRINNLPDDCLFHVFSYLSVEDRLRIHGVCKRWRDFGPAIWRNVRSLNLLNLVKSKTQHSRIVSLCGSFLLDLTIVIFEKSDVPRTAAEHCEALRRLGVMFESWDDANEQWQELSKLFRKNPRIRSVKFKNTETDWIRNFQILCELSEELEELELWIFKASIYVIPIVLYVPCDAALARFTKLRRLVLADFNIRNDFQAIQHMKELKSLEIRGCDYERLSLNNIAKLTTLEHLYLDKKGLGDEFFRELAKNNQNLRHLEIAHDAISADSMRELSKLPLLENLGILWTTQSCLPDENFGNFQNLRKFHGIVNERLAIFLLETSPHLEFIYLDGAEKLSPKVLQVAHQVTSRRVDIPLHIVVDSDVVNSWKKPEHMSPLLRVEPSQVYFKRTYCTVGSSSNSK